MNRPSSEFQIIDHKVTRLNFAISIVLLIALSQNLRADEPAPLDSPAVRQAMEAIKAFGGSADREKRDGPIVYARLSTNRITDENFPLVVEQLKAIPTLTKVDVSRCKVTSRSLPYLCQLTRLKSLGIDAFHVSDDDLAQLAALRELEVLDSTSFENVTDAGLKHLRGLTKLKDLSLGNSKVTDAGLVHLKDMENLESLFIYKTSITGSGFVHLADKKHLIEILAYDSQLGDEGLRHLANATEIINLALQGTKITDAGLSSLVRLKKLEWLMIGGCQGVNGRGLKGVTATNRFFCDGAPIDDGGMVGIAEGKERAWHLGFSQTKITDAGLRHLSGFNEGRNIDLSENQITGTGLVHLAGLEGLEDLDLSHCPISDDGLASIKQFKSQAVRLKLGHTAITDKGLAHLSGANNLELLSLADTKIGDDGLQYLTGMSRLKTLYLYRNRVTEAGFKKICAALPNCTVGWEAAQVKP